MDKTKADSRWYTVRHTYIVYIPEPCDCWQVNVCNWVRYIVFTVVQHTASSRGQRAWHGRVSKMCFLRMNQTRLKRVYFCAFECEHTIAVLSQIKDNPLA